MDTEFIILIVYGIFLWCVLFGKESREKSKPPVPAVRVMTKDKFLQRVCDRVRGKQQEESPSLAAQQAFSAALQRLRRINQRNRDMVGTQADVEARRSRVVEDMACRTAAGDHPPEPPMPRRREAILATRAKVKLRHEHGGDDE